MTPVGRRGAPAAVGAAIPRRRAASDPPPSMLQALRLGLSVGRWPILGFSVGLLVGLLVMLSIGYFDEEDAQSRRSWPLAEGLWQTARPANSSFGPISFQAEECLLALILRQGRASEHREGTAGRPKIVEWQSDSGSPVVMESIRLLQHVRPPAHQTRVVLTELLFRTPDASVRRACASTLSVLGIAESADYLSTLSTAMEAWDGDVCHGVLGAIGALPDRWSRAVDAVLAHVEVARSDDGLLRRRLEAVRDLRAMSEVNRRSFKEAYRHAVASGELRVSAALAQVSEIGRCLRPALDADASPSEPATPNGDQESSVRGR